MFSQKKYLELWLVSQILRHVAVAVTKLRKTKLKSPNHFSYAACRKEADERKQADFVSVKEELVGLFLGSDHTQMNILGLGPSCTVSRLIPRLNRLPQAELAGAGKWASVCQKITQSQNRKDHLVNCELTSSTPPIPPEFWLVGALVTSFGIFAV